jgi:hypothetical protein
MSPSPNKITSKAVEADAKYPIDVDSVDGIDAASSATADQLLALDGSSQLPASADMVDGKHAYTTPTANQLLTLDGSSKLPASITGDAHTVDGKHWGDFNKGSVTFLLGNKDSVLEADQKAMVSFAFACTITSVHIREVSEISGSVDLDIYRADGDDDSTWTALEDISMVSQWYRTETGKSWAITVDDWVKVQTNGDATNLKQIAVTIHFTRT